MNRTGLLREYLYVCTQFVWKCLMRALHAEDRWLVWQLKLWRFRLRNLMIVCPDCHQEIHHNPFLNARLIKQRARKLGVKYKKVYRT